MRKTLIGLVVVAFVTVAAVYGWRWHLISELRKPILAELNDPDSAIFRGDFILSAWDPSETLYCGEVNAKNRMGGYVGYKKFHVMHLSNSAETFHLGVEDGPVKPLDCRDYISEASWWWMRW